MLLANVHIQKDKLINILHKYSNGFFHMKRINVIYLDILASELSIVRPSNVMNTNNLCIMHKSFCLTNFSSKLKTLSLAKWFANGNLSFLIIHHIVLDATPFFILRGKIVNKIYCSIKIFLLILDIE